MLTDFFPEKGKSLFKLKKNYLCYCNFYFFLAHINVPLLVLITFRSISVLSWSVREIQWSKVCHSPRPQARFNYFWKLIPSCRVLQGVQLARREKLRSRMESRKWLAVLWLKVTNSVNCFRTLPLQLHFSYLTQTLKAKGRGGGSI